MTDLTEATLEQVLEDIAKYQEETGGKVCAKPTKMFIPRYPLESTEEYMDRVEKARQLIRSMK